LKVCVFVCWYIRYLKEWPSTMYTFFSLLTRYQRRQSMRESLYSEEPFWLKSFILFDEMQLWDNYLGECIRLRYTYNRIYTESVFSFNQRKGVFCRSNDLYTYVYMHGSHDDQQVDGWSGHLCLWNHWANCDEELVNQLQSSNFEFLVKLKNQLIENWECCSLMPCSFCKSANYW
jgi:hypothetical protein